MRDPDNRSASASLPIKVIDPATIPAISKVKYKPGKKLVILGERFDRAAVLMVDGLQMAVNPDDGAFVIKRITLAAGAHEFIVITPGGVASTPRTVTVN